MYCFTFSNDRSSYRHVHCTLYNRTSSLIGHQMPFSMSMYDCLTIIDTHRPSSVQGILNVRPCPLLSGRLSLYVVHC